MTEPTQTTNGVDFWLSVSLAAIGSALSVLMVPIVIADWSTLDILVFIQITLFAEIGIFFARKQSRSVGNA
jgi:hypothetical protein